MTIRFVSNPPSLSQMPDTSTRIFHSSQGAPIIKYLWIAMICLPELVTLLSTSAQADDVNFVRDIRPIFVTHCYSCHSEKKDESGFRLDVKSAAMRGGDNRGPDIVPGQAINSPLIQLIESTDESERMPPDSKLDATQIELIRNWIDQGAKWPDGIDEVQLKDKTDHWAFKPLRHQFDFHSIDDYIQEELQHATFVRSLPADPQTWLRRVTLDLTGLPPSPDETQRFRNPTDEDYEEVVNRLLASPRYGERWAQHWLDVVRYADTHGFEVNTERPNAWHYRDYVIRSFNNDTPYDQFVREQICGDAFQEVTATGFLITASVLLPGQIGKDAPSIRLARQDALDEIVNNISQSFLGLSVGCARCHDHKFDPITSRDYYAMQAFVAGVEYEERERTGPGAMALKREVQPLRERVNEIQSQLANFFPMARPMFKQVITDARENTDRFDPVEAKWIRMSIYDANEHPQLGLIEPCIDEIEIYSPFSDSPNLALASDGAKVKASGSNESDTHKLAFVNDGKYGNSSSWMSHLRGAGELTVELPTVSRIGRVVWSRDRLGEYSDRLATSYRLESSIDGTDWKTLKEVGSLRPTVGAGRINADRFPPVETTRLRFTIHATNSLEPCLDEIEVINTAGINVAHSSRNVTVVTSGDTVVAGRHDPSFVNDGQYGNERSWLSNTSGKGWVELRFAQPEVITRVMWSRDRIGKLEDRLPTEYAIEVERDGNWVVVADSTDRRPFIAGMVRGPEFNVTRLPDDEKTKAQTLLQEKGKLESQILQVESNLVAFAGKFRQPDSIHLLNRGDPEQPLELVNPSVIRSLGQLELDQQVTDQERRLALANWIVQRDNPLTARVMVNRIWQGHFGTGLVETPSDFGNSGMKPTHDELLDWLADQFIQGGWSIKRLHRLIVLSKTYRQSAKAELQTIALARQSDADNRLLWRFPVRRLDAEVIRDTMLEVSGLAKHQMYGRGYDLFRQRGGLSGFDPIEQFGASNVRRMIYAHKVRREKDAVFGAFDCPDGGQSTARRRESMTPIQALNLFNSSLTLQASEAFARRIEFEVEKNVALRVHRAFALALNREPTLAELDEAVQVVEEHGLPVLCRALLNCNEFVSLP